MRVTADGGFRWQETENAATRYADLGPDIQGRDAWLALVARVFAGEGFGALEDFLDKTAQLRHKNNPHKNKATRLFISHQRGDAGWADRIACLATSNGLDYWLDIHDPTLKWANGASITGAAKAVLIAGIIEMALLNCRYVVAVQTGSSAASKWIPYEFGRAKAHVLASDDAAGWYHPDVQAAAVAEYFELGRKTFGESPNPPTVAASPWNPWIRLVDWLQARAARAPRACSTSQTVSLP